MNPVNPPSPSGETLALPVEHLPRAEDFLLWPPGLQSHGYRMVDRLFASRRIESGPQPRDWPRGPQIAPVFDSGGVARSVADFFDRNTVAGLLVARDGRLVLEQYGLGLRPGDRWSTMSTIKSMT
ncbi:MAG: serine hydrolase, partial [Betaproteobacteria bacterium]|nr:serine hydrolase [Betaproteobacteria bacterium]